MAAASSAHSNSAILTHLSHALLRISRIPPRVIASPPTQPRRASVAILLRVRPTPEDEAWLADNHDPETQQVAPHPSVSASIDPSSSTSQYDLGQSGVHVSQASLPHDGTGPSSLASSTAGLDLAPTLDSFFSQPWVQRGTPEILYIKRAARIGDNWSAHVAFPGGRKEEGDENGLYTAMRETWEEVGIDLAEKEFSCVGQLDDREITTSLGKRLLMVLSPYVFVQTSPFSPLPDLQPTEVASAHWIPLSLLYTPKPKWGTTSVDISSRLAPKSPLVRWVLRALVGKMDFKCILLPNDPVAVAEYDPEDAEGYLADSAAYGGSDKAGSQIALNDDGLHRPELRLWGLTLGMTLDLLSHMTTYESNSSFRSGSATPAGGLSQSRPASPPVLRGSFPSIPPLASAQDPSSLPSASELVSSPLVSANRVLARIRDEFHLNPPPASHALAPSLTSVFPRFSYPDVNFWIWFFGWRYRNVVRGWEKSVGTRMERKFNWSGMALGAFYSAVRRALVVAVLLRALGMHLSRDSIGMATSTSAACDATVTGDGSRPNRRVAPTDTNRIPGAASSIRVLERSTQPPSSTSASGSAPKPAGKTSTRASTAASTSQARSGPATSSAASSSASASGEGLDVRTVARRKAAAIQSMQPFLESSTSTSSIQTTDVELLTKSILSNVERQAIVLRYQELLIDATPSLSDLKKSLLFLSTASWGQILEERNLADRCAYPPCPESAPSTSKLRARFKINLANKTVKDTSTLDLGSPGNTWNDLKGFFCSKSCYARSEWVLRWILSDDEVGVGASSSTGQNQGRGRGTSAGAGGPGASGKWSKLIANPRGYEDLELLEDIERQLGVDLDRPTTETENDDATSADLESMNLAAAMDAQSQRSLTAKTPAAKDLANRMGELRIIERTPDPSASMTNLSSHRDADAADAAHRTNSSTTPATAATVSSASASASSSPLIQKSSKPPPTSSSSRTPYDVDVPNHVGARFIDSASVNHASRVLPKNKKEKEWTDGGGDKGEEEEEDRLEKAQEQLSSIFRFASMAPGSRPLRGTRSGDLQISASTSADPNPNPLSRDRASSETGDHEDADEDDDDDGLDLAFEPSIPVSGTAPAPRSREDQDWQTWDSLPDSEKRQRAETRRLMQLALQVRDHQRGLGLLD
ncbi:hypothetical protein BCV70DRAFT_212271 [Testicularia cyperi]|uniref:RNA polymerase II subunit B1 CTD phosphatase RPAP2 homolog n=1 Tax=Testicularia cyperi TaxID=1882483 RepID=A0A317XMB7_9BASI|nr:hypothetical protein BCV70DRAFT_212271 [Testicularia cyperi]